MIRKSAIAALIAALALIFGGTLGTSAALASDKDDESGQVQIASDSEDVETEDSDSEEAQDQEDDSAESPEDESSEIEKKHQELDDMYGDAPSLSVPPLVIRPFRDSDDTKGFDKGDDGILGIDADSGTLPLGLAGLNFIAISPRDYPNVFSGGISPGTPINPEENSPITIQQINFEQATPAEVFLQASQIGLYVMGAGALALGALAGASIIRRK